MTYRSPGLLGGLALLTGAVGALVGVLAARGPLWPPGFDPLPAGVRTALLAGGLALMGGGYGLLLAHTVGVARGARGQGLPALLVEVALAGAPGLLVIGVLLYALLSL